MIVIITEFVSHNAMRVLLLINIAEYVRSETLIQCIALSLTNSLNERLRTMT